MECLFNWPVLFLWCRFDCFIPRDQCRSTSNSGSFARPISHRLKCAAFGQPGPNCRALYLVWPIVGFPFPVLKDSAFGTQPLSALWLNHDTRSLGHCSTNPQNDSRVKTQRDGERGDMDHIDSRNSPSCRTWDGPAIDHCIEEIASLSWFEAQTWRAIICGHLIAIDNVFGQVLWNIHCSAYHIHGVDPLSGVFPSKDCQRFVQWAVDGITAEII